MKISRGYVYRLYATGEQERQFRQAAGVARLVYNLALEQRRDHWRQHLRATGKGISFAGQCRELTALRREFAFIGAQAACAQQQALRDLEKAYSRWFKGICGYPSPRRRGINDSFRFPASECYLEQGSNGSRWGRVRLPKIGWVKFRDTRKIPDGAKLNSITVTCDSVGWHISVSWELEVADRELPEGAPVVGIDRGVKIPLMLSDGRSFKLPEQIAKIEKRHKRAQRVASRRKKGSKRWMKAIRRAAKLKAKQARVRKHWAHEVTKRISDSAGVVAVEALKTQQMTRSARGNAEQPGSNVKAKAGLNREILNVGWYQIESFIAYKIADRGGELVKVNPAYTSQTCSFCGVVDKGSRESQAVFKCRHCGHEENADLNAAKNIKRRASSPLLDVEACGCAACEASTHREVAA